jgi:hypothetical protein
MNAKQSVLEGSAVATLLTKIEESTRSNREAVRYFIEPAEGVLSRATSRRHHIIFGRRGSGKSSLLGKTYADQLVARRPCALVDLEEFKGHSYPDVLVSVLIKSFAEFQRWVDEAAIAATTKTSFWKLWTLQKPERARLTKVKAKELSQRISTEINGLSQVLHRPEAEKIEEGATAKRVKSDKLGGGAKLNANAVEVAATAEFGQITEHSRDVRSAYASNKIETLHRNIMRYKQMFQDIAAASGGDAFLLLDDLYHIRSTDQADVIDYFHRIAKGANLWLKIGTIRHRTNWYLAGDPPRGIKLGDDADEIDLDVTLEKYQTTKSFLFRILDQFAAESGVRLSTIMADGARDRLVLASGGVARDFLSLFRRAVSEARERVLNRGSARGEKVGSEDVNRAVGSYYDHKTEELKLDTDNRSRDEIMSQIESVRNFCIEKSEANCFLVEKDLDRNIEKMMGELVDLKFIHHVKSRVTVRGRERKVFDGFMLDLSFYTGDRARRGFEMIQFWQARAEDALRKPSLIFQEAAAR